MSLKDSIKLLQEAGFHIPDIVVKTSEDLENEAAGLAQVWECPKCKWRYGSPVELAVLGHLCQMNKFQDVEPLRRVWPRPGARQKSESP